MDPGQKRQGLSKYEETNLNTSLELPQSGRQEDGQNSEVSKRYEKNLARYLKETENCIKIRFRKKKIETERRIKSDGEIKTTADVSKISSILSKLNIGRSSAPSTFSDEKENSKKIAASKIPIFSAKNENNDFKDCKQSVTEISKLPIPSPTNILPTKASEVKQNRSKVLPSSTCLDTPDKSAKSENDSYEPPETQKSKTTTPSPKRPSDFFNVKKRQAFYVFAPGSSTGILRQCKSLPEIRRFRRREAMQRWSMNFEQHLRNANFGSEPRQSIQEVRSDVGTGYKTAARISNEATEISRAVPQVRETEDHSSLLLDRRPKINSKSALIYDDSDEMGKTESLHEAESFQKRKESASVAEYPFTSVKKGRISSEFKKNEIDTIDEGAEDNITPESKISPSEKDEPNK